jgi:hypothetical protein
MPPSLLPPSFPMQVPEAALLAAALPGGSRTRAVSRVASSCPSPTAAASRQAPAAGRRTPQPPPVSGPRPALAPSVPEFAWGRGGAGAGSGGTAGEAAYAAMQASEANDLTQPLYARRLGPPQGAISPPFEGTAPGLLLKSEGRTGDTVREGGGRQGNGLFCVVSNTHTVSHSVRETSSSSSSVSGADPAPSAPAPARPQR